MRQLTALKTTDLGFVFDRVDAFEPELLAAPHFFLPLAERNGLLFAKSPHSFEFLEIGQRPVVFPVIGRMALVKGHSL